MKQSSSQSVSQSINVLTSSDESDTDEERREGNVHLCCHFGARWYSRYWYLTLVHLIFPYNYSWRPIEHAQTVLQVLNKKKCIA